MLALLIKNQSDRPFPIYRGDIVFALPLLNPLKEFSLRQTRGDSIYGLCHKLWLNNSTSKLAVIQFYIHQIGSAVILIGLFLLYGQFVDLETIDPVLAVASITVFAGVILMKIEFVRCTRNK